MTTTIKIQYATDAVFGSTNPWAEGIDVDKSLDCLTDSILDALRRDYPGASVEIEITDVTDRVNIYSDELDDTDDDIERIKDAMEEVWSDYAWLVRVPYHQEVTYQGERYFLRQMAHGEVSLAIQEMAAMREGGASPWMASAVDIDGRDCTVYWEFPLQGEEGPEDAGAFPWDDEDCMEISYH